VRSRSAVPVSDGPAKVLFLVLDGLSPRHVDDSVMPTLAGLARSGGWCRAGGIGVMPTSTYPNHATFVTGVPPGIHGIVANQLSIGDRAVPSWEQGPAVRTLFDAMHDVGRPAAAVFGDHHLVGVTGARRADFLWPDGEWEGGVARDVLGYAKDRETATRVVESVGNGAHLVVAQLNEPDTAAHLFGPDSPEALHRYGRTDSCVATIADSLRPQWDHWVVVVVSDHSQETVTEPAPVDLRAAAFDRGLDGLVLDDGAAAVVGGGLAREPDWVRTVPGVDGVTRLNADSALVWAREGRWFSSVELPVAGVHGSPRTAPQVAVVTGGHPATHLLAQEISRRRPPAAWWAPRLARLLGIADPSG
jgi:predicted AlkP superfamily pyrophosphatase or phosphodiesterase